MTDPTPNIPLLRKAVEWAEAEALKPEPEREWEQATWFADPADHAAAIAERELGSEKLSYTDYRSRIAELTPACGTAYCIAGYIGSLDGWEDTWGGPSGEFVEDFAQEQLGLTDNEAENLFHADNDIAAVRVAAEAIAARVGERL